MKTIGVNDDPARRVTTYIAELSRQEHYALERLAYGHGSEHGFLSQYIDKDLGPILEKLSKSRPEWIVSMLRKAADDLEMTDEDRSGEEQA